MPQLDLDFAPKPPKRPRSFHVRSHVTISEAEAGEVRAQRQEDVILAFFRARPGERLTPWDVADALGLFVVSVRRGITNLTHRGLLIHYSADRRPAGPFGQKSAVWGLA